MGGEHLFEMKKAMKKTARDDDLRLTAPTRITRRKTGKQQAYLMDSKGIYILGLTKKKHAGYLDKIQQLKRLVDDGAIRTKAAAKVWLVTGAIIE